MGGVGGDDNDDDDDNNHSDDNKNNNNNNRIYKQTHSQSSWFQKVSQVYLN